MKNISNHSIRNSGLENVKSLTSKAWKMNKKEYSIALYTALKAYSTYQYGTIEKYPFEILKQKFVSLKELLEE